MGLKDVLKGGEEVIAGAVGEAVSGGSKGGRLVTEGGVLLGEDAEERKQAQEKKEREAKQLREAEAEQNDGSEPI